MAVVPGLRGVVCRSTWQANGELGGPAEFRDGGLGGVSEPVLCGHSLVSTTDESSGQCFHPGSHWMGESDAGGLQPTSLGSEPCFPSQRGCGSDVLGA